MTAVPHVAFSNVLYLSVMTLAGTEVSPVELSVFSWLSSSRCGHSAEFHREGVSLQLGS